MPKKKPTDDEVVLYIASKNIEAEKAALPRTEAMQELWQVYQNKQDVTKENWQSRCFVPKSYMVIERASALVEKALFEIGKLFKMKVPESAKTSPQATKALEAKREKDEAAFKERLENSNFVNIYSEASKCGFILGLSAIKKLWENGFLFENTNVMNLRIDPYMKPMQKPGYMIERKEIPLATLKQIAKRVNKAAGRQIYRMKEINKLAAQEASQEDKLKERMSIGLGDWVPTVKMVEIWEFWGDIIDKDDNILEDQLIVIAERNRIIRWHDNPFDSKKPPWSLNTPIVYPHRGISGISLIEPVVRLNYTMNNLFNLAVDNMNFTVNKVYEVNPNVLFDAHSVNRVFPGKMIKSRQIGAGIQETKTTPLTPETFRAIEMMERQMEAGTAVTEFLEGSSPRKRQTKGEVEIKTAEAHTMFDMIARRLEENSIKPFLQDCWQLMKQFAGFTGDYEFKVGGLSLLLMQKEQTNKVMQILAMTGQAQMLAQMTDIPELWQKLLSIYNLSEVYKEPERGRQSPPVNAPERKGIDERAAADAQKMVSRLSPQQIFSMTQKMAQKKGAA